LVRGCAERVDAAADTSAPQHEYAGRAVRHRGKPQHAVGVIAECRWVGPAAAPATTHQGDRVARDLAVALFPGDNVGAVEQCAGVHGSQLGDIEDHHGLDELSRFEMFPPGCVSKEANWS